MRSRHLLCLGLWSVLATFGWSPTPVDAQAVGGTTTTTTTQTTVETDVPEPAPAAEPTPAAPSPAQTAQAAPSAGQESINLTADLEPEGDTPRRPMWFFGGQFRHHWVPTGIQEIFMDMAPNIKGPGYGVLASRRNVDGFSLTFGLAYTDYGFEGFFRQKGDDLGETEYVKSDMSLWHVTSSFMWSTEFLDVLAFEYGFGLDLGLVFGDINRTEAYRDPSAGWRRCQAAGSPSIAVNADERYCDDPQARADDPGATTDPSGKKGAHYNVDVGKISGGGSIPDIFLVPAIPQLAIRFQPIRNVALRLEAGYGIVQFWVGASLLVGFETGEVPHAAPPPPPPPPPQQRVARTEVVERRVEVTPPPVVAPAPPTKGRVRGMAWSEAEQRPVAGAVVKLIGMELSSLVSGDDGSFVTYDLDPGLVTFELSHADYETATCAATVPGTGGEVQARCVLVPKPKKGAVNGSVTGARNAPLAGVQIQLTGPTPLTAVTDAGGTFSLEGVTPGTYAIRAEAEGYLVKLDQVVVVADITAQPRLVLTEKPRNSVVDVRENEIVITRQINFVTNSAKIRPDAEPILIEVADVMLRHPHIRRVEVQGHTDNKGRAARNLELSQQRAESVRDWLIGAGVEGSRLVARGYGQNEPIEDNRTAAGRTKNRRVQFMIREQAPREQ